MKKIVRWSAVSAALVLALTACGDAPEDEETDAGGTATSGSGETYKACAVLDVGGVDDRSFNQSVWLGLQNAQEELGEDRLEISYVQSQSEADYEPNLRTQAESCDGVIATGALLIEATGTVAPEFPDVDFLQIDGPSTADNVYGAQYYTEQSGFLGGYLAASLSQTGAIGTWGGINVGRGVTGYMEGYRLGAEYYNQQKGAAVRVLGWDGTDGTFAGTFTEAPVGRSTSEALISQGADIIFPVAGGAGTGAFTAAEAAGGSVSVIWVDFPGCEFYAEYCSYIPTSVLKGIPQNIVDYFTEAVEGEAPTGDYEGTLENGGTDIDVFNQFEDRVSDETKAELETIRQSIIDGTIEVPRVSG